MNAKKLIEKELDFIISKIEQIPLLVFNFSCLEKGLNNKPHYHFLISFKNIIGFNKNFIYNIKNYLIESLDEDDIRCDLISSFLEYKNRFLYIIKDEESNKIFYFYKNEK